MEMNYVDSVSAADHPLVNPTGPGHNRRNVSFSKSEPSGKNNFKNYWMGCD